MANEKPEYDFVIVPGSSLPSQPWWPSLHTIIIESFLNKDFSAFPPSWTRLNTDPTKGATGLAEELGENGHFAVAFVQKDGQPVACGGVLPFRGNNWIDEVGKKDPIDVANGPIVKSEIPSSGLDSSVVPDWEVCCFCVHPSQRGRGLSYQLLDRLVAFIKPKGAKRLISNYSVEETGQFWPRLGFEVIPGAGGVLHKGFKTDPDKDGLREDIYFKMGAKTL